MLLFQGLRRMNPSNFWIHIRWSLNPLKLYETYTSTFTSRSPVERRNTPNGSIPSKRLRATLIRTHTTTTWLRLVMQLSSYCFCSSPAYLIRIQDPIPPAFQSLVNSNNPEKLVLLLFYLAEGTTEAQRNQVICPRSHSCLKTIKLHQVKGGWLFTCTQIFYFY